ncbi:MAG: acyl-CoA dehydrogenase [Herminiimonas sp.]|nr:acyl-CoA dehydrogenase [Herminiimonas sp.]
MTMDARETQRQDDLRLVSESALAFASRETPLSRVRGMRGRKPEFDRGIWNKLAAQGWTGLLAAEQFGGHAQGFAEMAAIIAELADRLTPEPLTPAVVLAGGVLRHCPDTEQKSRLLTALAAGELIPALAWQDGGGGPDTALATTATHASRSGNRIRLTGEKRHIRPGTGADGYIVSVQDRDFSLYWMPSDSAGMQIEEEALADGTWSARLRLDGAAVLPQQCLCSGDAALSALTRAYDETLVMASVELLAVMRRMLSMTLEYLRTRVQFGKPIGAFQSLQHRAVDLLIQQELTAAVVGQAIAALDAGANADADLQARASVASRAKARASDACLLVARESVQMHGAMGFTDECDLGLYVQRALVLSAWLGNGLAHRRRFGAVNPLGGAGAA